VFPGATSGMYVPEEVQDFDNAPASETPPTPEPKRARDLKAEAPKQVEADPKRAKAETWLAWLRDEVDAAGGEVEAVRAIFADGAPTLAKLEKEYPDLYAEALALKPSDGEQPAEAKAAEIKAALAAAPDAEAVERVIAEAGAHIPGMADELGASLEIAFDQARRRVAPKETVE
jgi:hypothetical protein